MSMGYSLHHLCEEAKLDDYLLLRNNNHYWRQMSITQGIQPSSSLSQFTLESVVIV